MRKKRDFSIEHEFISFIPREMRERMLYVSIEFATASHRCFCGCGAEVVTPISPVGWQLTFDGESVSLAPSIGSWTLKCKSHYWIRRNRVMWAGPMSAEKIAQVQQRDYADVLRHFGSQGPVTIQPAPAKPQPAKAQGRKRVLTRIKELFR
jgi:hypothetical protein